MKRYTTRSVPADVGACTVTREVHFVRTSLSVCDRLKYLMQALSWSTFTPTCPGAPCWQSIENAGAEGAEEERKKVILA